MDRPTGRVIRRYERDQPGELIHVDVKKGVRGCASHRRVGSASAVRPYTSNNGDPGP
jgi:hypothetical protein